MNRGSRTSQSLATPKAKKQDFSWGFWPAVPLYPYGQRQTLRTEVLKDTLWTFDQLQGILYVAVPVRMTVVKLSQGGLLVYAPVAPTPECIRLMNELVAEHGDVKYIILPTSSGIEHKVFVGPFARKFPDAQIFVAPNQWSFPLNLPLSWLGFPSKRTYELPADSREAPFGDEFDYAILSLDLGLGGFDEVAFFHRRSHTLLVTDSVLSVPDEPPAITQLDPYPLLFHARDRASETVKDSPENRRKGWHRTALYAFYFRPSALDAVKLFPSLRDALKAPDRSRKAYWGWYPFQWKPNWEESFRALRGEGRLFVAPILQTLILCRSPWDVLAWANRVASWDFQRIIPGHLDAPIYATPQQFREAFAFLEHPSPQVEGRFQTEPLPVEDFELLWQIDDTLKKVGITPTQK